MKAYPTLLILIMVLEPLFPKLTKARILYRCYEQGDKLFLEIGEGYVKNYTFVVKKLSIISGTQMLDPLVTYEIFEDHFTKIKDKGRMNYQKMKQAEKFLHEIYEFRETHHITEYK